MEFVFVVPRSALFPDRYPHGLALFADAHELQRTARSAGVVDRAHFETSVAREGFFVERAYAEKTPALKQVIPYSIVVSSERILLTKRMKTGGESRLHEKYSIGIGGHINPVDAESSSGAVRDPVERGTRREIAEELAVRGSYNIRRVGLINDDSNAVGAVHVGVVQIVQCDGPVEIREREQLEGRLTTIDELQKLHATGADIESWSELLIPHLDELIPAHLAVNS